MASLVTGYQEKERARLSILEDAHIVCSTLSFAGSGIFARMSRRFDVIIIDEAAQAVEPSTLVPLVNGCKQVSGTKAACRLVW